jgi:RNA polymerase sigma-70 factor (ECF subfamily)
VEVMSMDRKLWTEARAIAARHGRGESEDLAQDLMVAALEDRGAIERPGAWLERVGRNAAIDRWRVERRREELAPAIEAPVGAPDPETALLCRERRGLVRRALAALPRPQRRAAIARFHADLPYEGVAERIGTEPVTARTRVHRALARLRARLGELRGLCPAWPAAHATALGLTILAAAPAMAPRPLELAAGGETRATGSARSRPPVRVIATASKPAAEPTPTVTPSRPDVTQVSAIQRFTFDDEDVLGDVKGPDGEVLRALLPAEHPSLIEIRRHFVPEMVKSLEDL